MEYTDVVKKIITTDFKTEEDFYKERDKQIEKTQTKIDVLEEKIKALEMQKKELEKIMIQLNEL